jgi:hypothetical protein
MSSLSWIVIGKVVLIEDRIALAEVGPDPGNGFVP